MPKLVKTYDARLELKLERAILERIQATAGRGKVNDWARQAFNEKLARESGKDRNSIALRHLNAPTTPQNHP